MSITQERMTRLLAASEDLQAGLKRALEYVQGASERARAPGGNAQVELETLESMLAPEFLLQQPLLTLMAIEREREHWSESRIERNTAKRLARKQSEDNNHGE